MGPSGVRLVRSEVRSSGISRRGSTDPELRLIAVEVGGPNVPAGVSAIRADVCRNAHGEPLQAGEKPSDHRKHVWKRWMPFLGHLTPHHRTEIAGDCASVACTVWWSAA